MVIVAVLAQVGFTGNPRYVLPPAAIVALLAGLGVISIGRLLAAHLRRRRAIAAGVVLALVAVPTTAGASVKLYDHVMTLRDVVRLYGELPSVIAKAGGPGALRNCGTIATGPYQTPVVAWLLHVPQHRVTLEAAVPGVIIAPFYHPEFTHDTRFPLAAQGGRWTIRSSCARSH
jgi:hypothetical protein